MSNTHINLTEFQESISKELEVVKNRVRNLIGDTHWGEEGRYKESILKKVISKYLPDNLSIGTGFIIKSCSDGASSSKQLDLIIYDNSYPVIFKEGDFVILTPSCIRGVIEVKSNISCISNLDDIIDKFNYLKSFLDSNTNKVFKGIFSYESDVNCNEITNRYLDGFVNHISLGTDYFIKYWDNFYSVYKIN